MDDWLVRFVSNQLLFLEKCPACSNWDDLPSNSISSNTIRCVLLSIFVQSTEPNLSEYLFHEYIMYVLALTLKLKVRWESNWMKMKEWNTFQLIKIFLVLLYGGRKSKWAALSVNNGRRKWNEMKSNEPVSQKHCRQRKWRKRKRKIGPLVNENRKRVESMPKVNIEDIYKLIFVKDIKGHLIIWWNRCEFNKRKDYDPMITILVDEWICVSSSSSSFSSRG